MRSTYVLGENIYINLTNRCTCNCDFCIRHTTDHVADSGSLWIAPGQEPTVREVVDEVLSYDLRAYSEIVFCGFGEPTCRLDDLLAICKALKRKRVRNPIRVNTNGHASYIAKADVSSRFKRMVDTVSVSLNAPDPARYVSRCHPEGGAAAFYAMLDFAASVRYYVPHVVFTIVDTMDPEEQTACRELAEAMEIPIRVRHYTENYDEPKGE